ncbi:hypothetical protein TWF694_002530 [Orbilia ellipsospora]|uniref:Nucleoside phosphorylase domain-containing protein n=1 Tax=Orbilia ellipsospora TaxID=2528407 RepID=A0AAV9X4T2_9PEZI
MAPKLKESNYSIGVICAIPIELKAFLAILDEIHLAPDIDDRDANTYNFGRIGSHNVVIACLPGGQYGLTNAGIVAARMYLSFKNLKFGLMVGVGGGAPSESNDIRLGDLVISLPTGNSGGVIQ